MKAVFFGTPHSAVPSLRALADVSEVVAVITRPDAPRGRSGRPQPSAIAQVAEAGGFTLHRPEDRDQLASSIRSLGDFDVGVVVAFGMILRPEVLDFPSRGYLNVHFSVLPRWRGAAPVQRSILAGDLRTGVTLMQMDSGLDTGSTIATWSTEIGTDEDAAALTHRLAVGGAELLAANLGAHVAGQRATTRQDDALATYAHKIDSDERWVAPDRSVDEVLRTVRGLVPWPGAWIRHDSGAVRIHRAHTAEQSPPPGMIETHDTGVVCGFANGGVRIDQVQPAGKRSMDARDWVRGLQDGPGTFT